jgi:hypothetical protein
MADTAGESILQGSVILSFAVGWRVRSAPNWNHEEPVIKYSNPGGQHIMAGGMRWRRAPLKNRVLIRRRTVVPATKLSLWERISDIAATIKNAVLGITGMIVFIGFAILIYRAVATPTITILPISVPKEAADKGYTPEALALQLREQLISLIKEAKSGKPGAQIVSGSQFSAINVPQTGMSLEMIASEIRESFGTAKSSEISGSLERVGDAYRVRLLLERNGSFEILEPAPDSDIRRVMSVAAERILQTVDPYLFASVYLESDPHRANDLADHIIYTAPERDPIIAWAHRDQTRATQFRGTPQSRQRID